MPFATGAEISAQNPDSFVATQDRLYAPVNAKMTGQPVDPSGYRASLQVAQHKTPHSIFCRTCRAQFARRKTPLICRTRSIRTRHPAKCSPGIRRKAIRRQHGDMMSTPSFQQDPATTERYQAPIWRHLASDLERAADGQGVGDAYPFRTANAYSTYGHNFINRVLNRAVTANNPSQEIAPDAAAKNLLNANGSDLQLLRQTSRRRQMQSAELQAGDDGLRRSQERL